MKRTIHIQSASEPEDTTTIKMENLEELNFVQDAKKLAEVIINELPSGTFDELYRFFKVFERKASKLYIDENFEKYWKKRGAK